MNKETVVSILFAFLLLLSTVLVGFALPPSPTLTDTLVIDTISEPETSDPAWAYDDASAQVIQNVYEPLTAYKVDRTHGPYAAGFVDQFVPRIALSWEYDPVGFTPYTDPDTGIQIRHQFVFEIRTGIPFHPGGDGANWGTLTTEDVEYSFERMLVQDRDGGPQWMLYEYLLNTYGAEDPISEPNFGLMIDNAVDNNNAYVWFNIASDIPEVTILQRTAYCGGIVCKAWAQSLGDLNVESVTGGWSNWEEIWDTWHNPPTSYCEYVEGNDATKCVGTGPYRFVYWSHGSSWSVEAFDDYWGGWPARVEEDPGVGNNRISGFITTITWYLYTQWTTRRPRFLAGDSDFTVVDRLYRDHVLGQPGVRCYYPIGELALDAFFFTFDITTTSPYAPTFYPSGTFGTNGIPPDIFNDLNVRMGFAYAFDYNSWLANAFPEAWQPPDAIIRGLAYNRRPSENIYATYDEENPTLLGPPYKYYYNMANAEYYLKMAFGGSDPNSDGVVEPGDEGALWTGGMKFTIVYNSGNIARQLAAEMLTSKIRILNTEWNVGEPVIRDNNNNGIYDAGDTVLCGVAPPLGTVLGFSDDFEKYADLGVNEWDTNEPVIRDNNNNGIYDWGDDVLCGFAPPLYTILGVPDDFEKYADFPEWDAEEPAIRDNDNDGIFNSEIDTVLAGFAPPDDTILRIPDDFEKFADLNANEEWDVGEPAIRDNDDDGIFNSEIDTVLAGFAPPDDTILRIPDDFERYADLNLDWDTNEPAVRDNDDDGAYDYDTVLVGVTPDLGTVVSSPDDFEKFADLNANEEWDVGEPAIRDNDDDGIFNSEIDTVLAGFAPPDDTILRIPDDFEKFADLNANEEWDVGEPAIRDNDGTYDYDTVLCGVAPPIGTPLKVPDDFEKFADLGINEWDTNEPAIRDNNNDGVYDAGDTVLCGVAPPIGTPLKVPDDYEKFAKTNPLDPKFLLDPPFAVPYGSTYLPQMVNGELPLFIMGWASDYPDPHNFAFPFYHTFGTFAEWQKYSNPTMDNLIETGIATPDGSARSAIYQQIQELAVTDCPSVGLVQALGRHFERDWVRGWYYRQIPYFYHLWKARSAEFGDANNDGHENIADKGYIAGHWTGAPGTTYNPSADFTGGTGGTTGSNSGLVKGIPDGVVDTVDLAVLSANWDSI